MELQNPNIAMQFLSLIGVGPYQVGHLNEILKVCCHSGCRILKSEASLYQDQWLMVLRVSGNWSHLAKLESAVPFLATKLGLQLYVYRSAFKGFFQDKAIHYLVQIIGQEHPKAIPSIIDFFSEREIYIHHMQSELYRSGSLFIIDLRIELPQSLSLGSLREEFLIYCDEYNLDGILEFQKPC